MSVYQPPESLALPDQAQERIHLYEQELLRWNARINLIAKSTIANLHRRHFDDSLGILPFLPIKPCCLADLGSGAGFPGMMIALTTAHRVTLVESTHKKTVFLRHVSQRCQVECAIKSQRIETLDAQQFDVITARALARLPQLWQWSKPLLRPGGFCAFLKGDSAITQQEISSVRSLDSSARIDRQKHPYNNGVIVLIRSSDSP